MYVINYRVLVMPHMSKTLMHIPLGSPTSHIKVPGHLMNGTTLQDWTHDHVFWHEHLLGIPVVVTSVSFLLIGSGILVVIYAGSRPGCQSEV